MAFPGKIVSHFKFENKIGKIKDCHYDLAV